MAAQIVPLLAFAFLAPAFAVAGLVLAGVPLLIHLLNRRRYKVVDWAAMDFLLRAMRKNRRRVRFEQWLLLACRCLVLAALGLALSRPLGCDANSTAAAALGGARTGLHVFVIDNGYAAAQHEPGQPSHLDRARAAADAVIDRLASGGESVAVITTARPTGPPAGPTYDLQQARGMVDRVRQTFAATDLPAALRRAADLARAEARQPNRSLYVLTDATAGTWQGGDAAAVRAAGAELGQLYRSVVVTNLSAHGGPPWNQAVTDVRPTAALVTTNADFAPDFQATVRGFGPSRPAVLQWKVDGRVIDGSGPLPPLGPTTPPVQEPRDKVTAALHSGGPHVVTAALVGPTDALPADDAFARVVNVVSALKVLIVEGEHGVGVEGGSALNLQVALAAKGADGQSQGFAVPEVISDLELDGRVLTDYRAVILTAVQQVTPAEADRLAAFVRGGGTLMVWLGEHVSRENYNAVMLPRGLIPGPLTKPVVAAEGSNGYQFDFNPNGDLHPLLHLFAHQSDTGLDRATAYGYWQCDAPLDPQLRVLNWKNTGPPGRPDPAVTAQAVGQGRVVFVSTAAADPWITFTHSAIYTELVNELLNGSVTAGDGWMNLTVGDRLDLPPSVKMSAAPRLIDPAGTAVPLEPATAADGSSTYRSPPLDRPGVYQLATGGGGPATPVSVTVAAGATDVRSVDDGAVRAALGNIDLTFADDGPPPVSTAAAAASLDQGWNVMLIVFLLVGGEAFLAMRFGHYRKR